MKISIFLISLIAVDAAAAGHPNARNRNGLVKWISQQVRVGNQDVLVKGAYRQKTRQGAAKSIVPMESRIVLRNNTLEVQQRKFGARSWGKVSEMAVSRDGLTKGQRRELRAKLDRMFVKTHVGPKWKARAVAQSITSRGLSEGRHALPLYLPPIAGIETYDLYQERVRVFAMTYKRPVYGVYRSLQNSRILLSRPNDTGATWPKVVANKKRTAPLAELLTVGIKEAMRGASGFSKKQIEHFALHSPIELALYPGNYNQRDMAEIAKFRSAFGDADGIKIVAPKGIDTTALAKQFNVKKEPARNSSGTRLNWKNLKTRLADLWQGKKNQRKPLSYADKAADFAVQVHAKHLELHE